MIQALGWAAITLGFGVGIYAYALYPALLKVVGTLRPRPPRADVPGTWPVVSITVPAYNEETAIGPTLDCLLATDYPAERRQILVVSDASSDRTDDIVRGYAGRGVELLRLDRRGGKTAAENAALAHLRGTIVINTDASVRIHAAALKPLIQRFSDPTVGVASGRDVSVARVDETANAGESGYVGYEMWVRALETRVDSIIGASGCFYGIRRELHSHLVPEALSRDFSAALTARAHGFRAVSVDDAVCFVPRASGLRTEFRRKVRTITRGIETLYYRRQLLNPFRYGVFAWLLFSHKVCRWLLPWLMVLAGLGVALLALDATWARAALAAGALVLLAAGVAWYWPADRRVPRLLALPAFAVWGNLAVLVSCVRALRGELNPIWEPTRRTAVDVHQA